MRVLVACEFSGIVRDAFAAKGHDAWSCDLLPVEKPGNHIQDNVLNYLKDGWDLMIAHPPCTYLCVPGAHYLHTIFGRWNDLGKAHGFFMKLYNADIRKICIENPVPNRYAKLPKYSQIIHPWQHGHETNKRTCLWLKNLPLLKSTDIKYYHGERHKRTARQQKKYGRWSNSKWYASSNGKKRSRTFQGIADAMAEQWG
jgi:hypothetical protein